MRDAEVGDLHRPVRRQEHVRRLDVAVDHALAMRIVERVEDLSHQAHGIGGLEPLAPFEALPQVAPGDVLHRDERRAGVLVEVVDRDDVRMIQTSRGLRLAAESREHDRRVLALKLVGADRLQRDDPLDHRIVGLVDDAHGPAAELAADLVLAQLLSHSDEKRVRKVSAG